MLQKLMRKGLLALVVSLLFAAVLLFEAVRAGQAAMQSSDEEFNRGALGASIQSASRALRWDFPFAPHVSEAQARLLAIAVGAEAAGDNELALSAWGALRGAVYETAHPWKRDAALLQVTNAAIVRLLPRPPSLLTSVPEAARLAEQYAASDQPKSVFYAATGAGMLLLLLGAAMLLLRRSGQSPLIGLSSFGTGLFLWVFAAIGA
jgi:hypothetical protein